jgi:hypothetical protein
VRPNDFPSDAAVLSAYWKTVPYVGTIKSNCEECCAFHELADHRLGREPINSDLLAGAFAFGGKAAIRYAPIIARSSATKSSNSLAL